MTNDSTVLRITTAAPAMVAGKPQAAPPPDLAFGDMLAGMIQVGRIEDLQRPDREVDVAVKLEPGREAAEGGNAMRFIERDRPEVDNAPDVNGDECVSAESARETVIEREATTVTNTERAVTTSQASVKEGAPQQAVNVDLEGVLMKAAPVTAAKEEVQAPLDTYTYESATKAPQFDLTAQVQVSTEPVAAEAVPVRGMTDQVQLNAALVQTAITPTGGAPVQTQGDLSGESRMGTSQSALDRAAAPAAKDAAGGMFAKLIATEKEAGASQQAMIEKILKFTRNRGMRAAANIRMTLNPPKLGALHMDINVRDGSMSVLCRADNPSARAMLMGGIDDLRAALASEGIALGEFSVSVNHEGEQDNSSAQEHFSTNAGRRTDETVPSARDTVLVAAAAPGLVDLTA